MFIHVKDCVELSQNFLTDEISFLSIHSKTLKD